MIETFAALALAHLAADFALQTNGMVTNKRRPDVFALHIVLVFAAAVAALGGAVVLAAAVAGAHAVIDAVKTWILPEPLRDGLPAFGADQAAHVATLGAAAWWMPGAFAQGLWAELPFHMPHFQVLAAGAILATLAGAPVIRAVMVPFAAGAPDETLPDAGRMIGLLERVLIYLMVLLGEPAGIGFLIAAKSVLRFEAAGKTRNAEYVIIGTLASFAWAIAASLLTRAALDWLGS